jgi:hypothetical protein
MTTKVPSTRYVTHFDFPVDFSEPVESLFTGKVDRVIIRRGHDGYRAEVHYAHGGIARGMISRPTIDRALTDVRDHLMVADHSF